MAVNTLPVVIMAGGPTPEKIMNAGESEPERAFIDINGKPMLQWVLDALADSGVTDGLLCIGNAERIKDVFGLEAHQVLRQRENMLENFMAGMDHFRERDLVMVVTCDIPLVTGDAIRDLMNRVNSIDAEIYYPIINVKDFDSKFAGGKRTTQALKEGTFTGGNIFILNPAKVIQNRSRVEAVIRDRKSPQKLIKLFGLGFIVKFLFKQLNMKGLEDKATQILGARMRAVVTPYPEIGFDVDKPEDLSMVRDIFRKNNA